MSWDLDHLRKIAGLPLNEAYDDDEDDDVRRADAELKKRKINLPKVKDVDPDKDIHNLAVSRKSHEKDDDAAKKHEEHEKKETAEHEKAEHEGKKPTASTEKKETPAEEKKEEAKAAEKKKRGRAEQEGSKSGKLRAWMKANPNAKRKEAWAHAQELGFTSAGFSTIHHGIKKKLAAGTQTNEWFFIRHPQLPSFWLAENGMMNMYQWISENDENMDPVMFESKQDAEKVADYLASFKNQGSVIDSVTLED